MKTKHTPGEWEVRKSEFATVIAVAGKDIQMAKVFRQKYMTAEEFEANAKLLAAAPELLEALQRIRELIAGDCRDSLHSESVTSCDFEAQLRVIRGNFLILDAIAFKAIAKATE